MFETLLDRDRDSDSSIPDMTLKEWIFFQISIGYNLPYLIPYQSVSDNELNTTPILVVLYR